MELSEKIKTLLDDNKKKQQQIVDNINDIRIMLLDKVKPLYTGKAIDILNGVFIVDNVYDVEYDEKENCFIMHVQGKAVYSDLSLYDARYNIDYFADMKFTINNNGEIKNRIIDNYIEEKFPKIQEYFKKVCSYEGKIIKRYANVAFINSAGHGIRGQICGFQEDTMHYMITTDKNQLDGQDNILIFKAGPELILI